MPASLRELLDMRTRESSSDVVLSAGGRDVTWAELAARARDIAAALVRDGIAPQTRVADLGKNSTDFFAVLFGCALARVIMTPVNWRLSHREITEIIAETEASAMFADGEFVGLAGQIKDALPGLRTPVGLAGHSRWPSIDEWSAGCDGDPGLIPRADDIAFQLYTSGTTGRPRGVMFANGTNLKTLLEDVSVAWGLSSEDVSLACMPLFHMGGLAWALAAMARGARTVVGRDFVAERMVDTMRHEQVTTAFFVPAMLARLCAAENIDASSLALRRVIYSGAPMSPAALTTAMKTLRCDFIQIYGLTEATGAIAQLSATDHDMSPPRTLPSAGSPYPWVEIKVVSMATLDNRATEEIGEIWTRSAQNMVGYWHLPEETARVLTHDGWLRTGDLGFLDDGRIYLVDRASDLIITGGENVYPAEAERVLASHPAVADAAVFGVPDARWGETVRAHVVLRPGHDVPATDLIAYARENLAGFKCPTGIAIVQSLPRTSTGKIIKHQLREPYWQGHDRRIN